LGVTVPLIFAINALLARQLFGVVAMSPALLLALTLFVLFLALSAAYLPARCAMMTDPARALRQG
jgi:ABC-type lipoprotein release transport system permease subunit